MPTPPQELLGIEDVWNDSMAWSLDTTLAIVLVKGLTHIIDHEFTETPEGAEAVRDTFAAYAVRWESDDECFTWDMPNHPNGAKLRDALLWVTENFTSLWT